MINRIYDYMVHNRMIESGSRVLAAVSGGADSMCLLEVLRELQDRTGICLRVFHVHHGLRQSAEGDLVYVSEFCEAAGIPFEAVRVDASGYAAEKGLSVEEAARHLRYEALEEAAKRWDKEEALKEAGNRRKTEAAPQEEKNKCRIAVAHHIEDQAETVLFNLVRGSRLTGMRGMLPVNGRIIRPLLMCSRAQIEEFLEGRGVSWREDETNEDIRYARNLLRREVMPLLRQVNAGVAEHIAKAAEEAAEAEEFLRSEPERAFEACCTVQASEGPQPDLPKDINAKQPASGVNREQEQFFVLSIPELMREEPLIRRRVVYAVIAKAAGRKKDLLDAHVRAVLELARKNGNGRLDVLGGVCVEKLYDKMLFYAGPGGRIGGSGQETVRAKSAAVSSRTWPMEAAEYSCRVFDFDGDLSAVPRNQYTKWLDYDKIGTFPSFRPRRKGDRITLDESGRSKTVARYMIDTKVPPELRYRIILPAADGVILWIPSAWADPLQQSEAQKLKMRQPETQKLNTRQPETQNPEIQQPETQETETSRSSESGRISAAFKVSGGTRRILEIRWDPEGSR